MHRPEVWAAVAELAYILHEGMEWPEAPGAETYTLPGATVRAIVRRSERATRPDEGLHPDQLTTESDG